jgi:hypothetical protein
MIASLGSPQPLLHAKDTITCPSEELRSFDFGPGVGHYLPYHFLDFWLNLALCHALLVDNSEGQAAYTVRHP